MALTSVPLLKKHLEQAAAFRAKRRGRPSLHTLRIEAVTPLTDDSMMVTFAVPEHLRDAYRFKHGQHVAIVHEGESGEIRRSYSICAPAHSDELRIAIRRVPGGAFSEYALSELRAGQELRVMTPTGRFTTELDAGAVKHYGAVAGGSGITPILSMAHTILEIERQSRVTLLYANRGRASTMFWDELERLRAVYRDRLEIHHCWSREPHPDGAPPARLDGERLRALVETMVSRRPVDQWILCGPHGLMETVVDTLGEHGVDDGQIHRELFTVQGTDAPVDMHERPLVESDVSIVLDGEESRFRLSSHGEPVLAAALRLRTDVPYSCSEGVCATCRAKVVEGDVDMVRCSALDRREIEEGFVLACQSHPVTPRVVLDFDA